MKLNLFVILFSFSIYANSQINISEVQSANASTIQDNMGEYSDWIELHNPSKSPVDIGGMVLKDNVDT